jgi:hypothetical protein
MSHPLPDKAKELSGMSSDEVNLVPDFAQCDRTGFTVRIILYSGRLLKVDRALQWTSQNL